MDSEQVVAAAIDGASADPRTRALREVLGSAADRCRLVGGCVRDWAVGIRPGELDVVIDGDLELLGSLPDTKSVSANGRFMTAEVSWDWGRVDFAQVRKETYQQPGALPEVEAGSIEDDVRRRDFTINALTLSLSDMTPGGLEQGWQDLEGRVVRVLHSKSFVDDPTRLWRLARFAGRLGFEIDGWTDGLARDAVGGGALDTVSGRRKGNELLLAVSGAEPDAAILGAAELGLLGSGLSLQQLSAVISAGRSAAGGMVSDAELRVAAVGSLALEFERGREPGLELPDPLARTLLEARRLGTLGAGLRDAARPSEIAAVCEGWTPGCVACAAAHGVADEVTLWLGELSRMELPIDGDALLAAGIPSGPAVGIGLAAARDQMLDGGVTDPEQLLATAVSAAAAGGDDDQE